MSRYRCQYDHHGARMEGKSTHPVLVPVLDGHPRIIAWQCPECPRTWRHSTHIIPGDRGQEIEPLDTRARRAAMVAALVRENP
jgi:hypothetical protein